tara:strand:+ start:3740 stop:4126 length:387 start_codon:yes stop_codon:yes gene_type:complete
MKIWKKYLDDEKWVAPTEEPLEDFIKRTEGHGHWAEGTAVDELKMMGMLRTPYALYFASFPIPFKGGWVDADSLMVEGVDTKDYPDFVDSYLSLAEWVDGTPLSDDDLSELDSEMPELAHELATDFFI